MSAPDQQLARRAVRLILILAGREVRGLRLAEIGQGLGVAPATAHRLLGALEDEGVVERVPTMEDRWRLGPKLIQVAIAHRDGLATMQQQLDEVARRYSRRP